MLWSKLSWLSVYFCKRSLDKSFFFLKIFFLNENRLKIMLSSTIVIFNPVWKAFFAGKLEVQRLTKPSTPVS